MCIPSGSGGSGINVDALPPLPDPDALETHVQSMVAAGASFHNGVQDAARKWAGLRAYYRTPDSDQVLGAFTPALAKSMRVQDLCCRAAKILYAYADRARDFKRRVTALRAEVQVLDAMILANDDWQSKNQIVDTHQQLLSAASSLAQAVLDSDTQCANGISALTGGPTYDSAHIPRRSMFDSADQISNGFKVLQHYLGTDVPLPKMPWGSPVSVRHEDALSAGQGFLSAAVVAAQGFHTLLATTDEEEQARSWQGLGVLAKAVFTTKAAVDRGFTDMSDDDVEAVLTTVGVIKDSVHYDDWVSYPERAAGATVFDVGTMLAGGSGAGAKAGSVVARLGLSAERLSISAMDHPSLLRLSDTLNDVANGLHRAGLFLDKPGPLLLKLSDMAAPATTTKVLDGLTQANVNAWKALNTTANASADLVRGAKQATVEGLEQIAGGLSRVDQAFSAAAGHQPSGLVANTAGSHGPVSSKVDGTATPLRESSRNATPAPAPPGTPPTLVEPSPFPARESLANTYVIRHGDDLFPVSRRDNFAAKTSLQANTEYVVDHRTKMKDDYGGHTADTLEKFFTDTTGRVDRVDTYAGVKGAWSTELNKRMPNVTYNVVAKCDGGLENHFTYVTDEFAKPVSAEARITGLLKGDMNRSVWQQFLAGRRVGGPDYEGGHLIASLFAGPGEGANLLAQLMFQNRGYGTPNVGPGAMAFYRLERELISRALLRVDNGLPLDLRVKVEAIPGPRPGLPESLKVTHSFDGIRSKSRRFPNLPRTDMKTK